MITSQQASRFAALALKGIRTEYPNKLDHVMNDSGELRGPRALHPAFYGCFDWHSSVHSHWMLVRLLKIMPEMPEAEDIRAALHANLTVENILVERDYLEGPNRRSFERTYGWAWLLKLAEELHGWEADTSGWGENLQPLADRFVDRYLEFLPKQSYPIRAGTHPNTAFGLTFALDYARTSGNHELEKLVVDRSLTYFAGDTSYPAVWEPGGSDFLSPALVEADLMRRVLTPVEFKIWFARFLPGVGRAIPETLFTPATVADRTDPQIVHLDGLNLSRAWCMRNIAASMTADDPARQALAACAEMHAQAALPHVTSGDYMGEHWLASFAVYMFSTPEPFTM